MSLFKINRPAVKFNLLPMALHYILDGYNIIKQIPAYSFKGLKEGRDSLVSLIEMYRPQGSDKNLVTIVFDGQADVFYPQKPNPHCQVVFSTHQSADDKIRQIVDKSKSKSQMIVVTDDKELRFSVRAIGAKVMNVKEFLEKAKPFAPQEQSAGKKGKPPKDDEKYIPKTLEYKITTEMKKIWLKA